jgi:hypothetical protein
MFDFSTKYFKKYLLPLSIQPAARNLPDMWAETHIKCGLILSGTNQTVKSAKFYKTLGIPELLHAASERSMMTLMEHFDNFSFPICLKSGKVIILRSNMQAYEMAVFND